jgi:molybdopterin synthase sulfur carrier subunit
MFMPGSSQSPAFSYHTVVVNDFEPRRFQVTTVYIPTPLRRLTGGQSKVQMEADDIAGLIQGLEESYPGFAERILDGEGNAKRFIQIFRNDDEIRTLQGLKTPLSKGDRVSIVPAMAGGS